MSDLFNKVIDGKQFNFQHLEFGGETGYHVDVKDEDGQRWEFRMFNTGGKYSAINGENLPSWIMDLETELSKAVNQHE